MPTNTTVNNFNFSYKIESIDVENCSVVIKYIPENENLLIRTYNVNLRIHPKEVFGTHSSNNELIFPDDNQIPFENHVKYSIEISAPVHEWKVHQKMLESMEYLNSLKS